MDPTPHRPEAANPLDELSPTVRAAVEATRAQPVPLAAQEATLRRVEEEPPMSNRLASPPLWTRPSMVLAVLAASVAIAFGAGYWLRPAAATTTASEREQLALLKNPEVVNLLTAFQDQRQNETAHKGTPATNYSVDRIGDIAVPGETVPMTTTGSANTPTGLGMLPPPPPGTGGGAGGSTTLATTAGHPPFSAPGVLTGSYAPADAIPIGQGGPGAGGGGLGGLPTPMPTPDPASVTGPRTVFGTPVPGPGQPPLTNPSGFSPSPAPQAPPLPGAVPAVPPLLTRPKGLESEFHSLTQDQRKLIKDAAERWTRLPEAERRATVLSLQAKLNDVPPAQRAALVAAVQGLAIPPADRTGSETYNYFLDNPYLAVQNAPLSTFSTSVDTASYSNVRRFLMTDGRLPPKDAVRVADMLNYFPYAYPEPKGDAPVAFAMNMTTCPWNADHQLLRVALAAKTYKAEEMPPRNFTFLLDTSGSMRPEDRLPLLVKGLKLLVAQLRPQDRVAIVVYASAEGLLLASTPGNEKDKINAALDTLHASGSTNGFAGIQMAYKIAQENFIKGGVNRVILGTDGDWNVGTTNTADLIRFVQEKRKTGVFLTVLGVGRDNLKDGMMERLAHHGAGHYCYVNTMNEMKKIFVEQGGALTTVAKDVKLQVEFNPQRVAGYRLIGYENKLLRDQDFNNDKVHAGDMGSGHTVTALYEIIPAGLKMPNVLVDDLKYQKPALPAEAATTGEFLTVKMRYKDPEAETSQKLEQPLAGAVEKFAAAHEDIRWAAAVAEFGMLLRGSPYRGTATYTSALAIAEKALGGEDAHRVEFLALVKKARELAKEK